MQLPLYLFAAFLLILAVAYIAITLFYRHSWRSTPEYFPNRKKTPSTTVSIIVPARNEAENIVTCIKSILSQQYPHRLTEVIVIDDHSEDNTAALVHSIKDKRLQLLRLADHLPESEVSIAHKKKAIELGIQQASGELIITTDADCYTEPNWISTLVAFYEEKQMVMIAAPVVFHSEKTSLQRFQAMDFTGMMAVTAAGIRSGNMHLANGANLCYEKSAFEAVGGFEGIDKIASGDDLLLMQKMVRQFPGKIGFCKSYSATVFTLPQPDWPHFYRQRIRWATKSAQYPDWRITVVLAIVFFLCWGIILSILLAPFLGKTLLLIGLSALFLKSSVDYLLLSSTTRFFRKTELMRQFPVSQLWHIAYIAVIGLMANLKKEYEWKGRQTK